MDIASKADVTHGCVSNKKKSNIPKLLSLLLLQLIISCLSVTTVFAGEDNGTGWGVDHGEGQREWGYSDWAGGYRTYMIDSGGAIVSPVADMQFSEVPDGACELKTTIINGGIQEKYFQYSAVEGNLPGLKPPFYNYTAWGPNLDAWFESTDTKNGHDNASNWIAYIFGIQCGGDINDLYLGYHEGRYRIVVEALYWYRPVAGSGDMLKNYKGTRWWTYGNVNNIAWWNGLPNNTEMLSNLDPPAHGGGPYLGSFTNSQFNYAICLDYYDEFCGYDAPSIEGSNKTGEGGELTYADIKTVGQGFGMHIIKEDRASEKWYTNDASESGGPVGPVPGAAPEMKDLEGADQSIIRPVTVIKYYELINHINGKVEYENAGGPYKRTQICRTIEVQEEPGWDLVEHFQQTGEQMPNLWNDLTVPKFKRRFQATVVVVEEPNKVLYVLFRKEGRTEDTPDVGEGLDMILYESEISKAYITNQIKDNTEPEFKFTWNEPEIWSGHCHTDHGVGARPGSGNPSSPDYDPGDPGHDEGRNHQNSWTDNNLSLQLKLDDTKFNSFKYITGTVDPFKIKLNDENENYKTGDFNAEGITEKTLEDFSAKFVVWRGDDQPTINAYKASPGDSGQVDSLLDKTSADTKDQGQRKDSTDVKPEDRYYEENLSIFFKVDDGSGDYHISTECVCETGGHGCNGHTSDVSVLDNTPADRYYEFKGPVTVNYFNGDESDIVQKIKTLPDPPQTVKNGQYVTASGQQWRRYPAYDEMTFYPYVQMSYQTTDNAGTTDGGIVYVLSSYERGFKAGAALRITWSVSTYPGTGYSMLLRSDQWQTHATALEKYGKNMLLPGGAIYQLTSNGGPGVGELGFSMKLEAWYPDIDPTYEQGITKKDADWNGQNGASEFAALVSSAASNLGKNSRIEMRVTEGKQDNALNGIVITPGTDLSALGNNLKASTETKYYLKSTDPGAADSIMMSVGNNGGSLAGTYKVEAFPDGKVTISGGNSLTKKQGADSINSKQAAGKADAYTSEIQNFISQLQRNAGADKDTTFGNYWAKEDGTWYNESFGVKVNYYTGQITMKVPSNDGIGLGGVTAVLDPNLCPAHTSTATKFQSVNTAQFFVTLKSMTLGKFGSTTIAFPGYSGYLMASQPFYIADYTVQDND